MVNTHFAAETASKYNVALFESVVRLIDRKGANVFSSVRQGANKLDGEWLMVYAVPHKLTSADVESDVEGVLEMLADKGLLSMGSINATVQGDVIYDPHLTGKGKVFVSAYLHAPKINELKADGKRLANKTMSWLVDNATSLMGGF